MKKLMSVVAVLMLCVSGCGMTTAQRISMTGDSAYHLKEVAAPAWSAICKVKADKCVTDGITASKDCAPWVSCQAGLKGFYLAHVAVQTGVQKAAWWILQGDESTAKKVIMVAMDSLARAYKLAQAEGAFK